MSHTHVHGHAHGHAHDAPQVSAATLGGAVALTLAFVLAEAIGGWWGNSLALLSDAGHNLADAATLGLSWYALWMAGKPSHERMTFGYHRVGVFAALINAVSLVLIALFIGWEGIERLRHPEPASGVLMIVLATVAITVNLAIGSRLHQGAKHDINVRSAYIHMIGDAVSAFGVVIAGIIIATTQWLLADPIVSLVIAALILYSSYGVLSESATVLLEGTPADEECRGRARRPRSPRVDGRPRGRRVQLPYRGRRAERARRAAGAARGCPRHRTTVPHHAHDGSG